MSVSSVLEELLLEELPSVSSPRRLFEALAHFQLSPSRSLPNELLSYIFLLASDDHENHYDAVVTPVWISHVCSHWRQVALLTGSLWTNLILAFPVSRPQLSRAIAWLNRSQKYPIDILFDFRDPAWDWEEESHSFRWQDMEVILRLFLPHVQRWRRFELLTDTWAPIFTFLWYTRKAESAPMLETLSLSRCNAYFASKQESFHPVKLKEPITLFGGLVLEKLRDVTLAGVHVDWSASKLHNLTSLNFKYQASDVMPTLGEFIAILTSCPDLEQLSIIGWGPQFPSSSNDEESLERNEGGSSKKLQQPIHLPCLKQFHFGFVDADYAIKLISLFRLPVLEEFTLDDVIGGLDPLDHVDATPLLAWMLGNYDEACSTKPDSIEPLEAFPFTSIRTLHLENTQADEGIWAKLFHATSNLHFLTLNNVPKSALRALSSSHPQPPHNTFPCPLLKRLNCQNVDPDVLAEVITARLAINSTPPLGTIVFFTPEHNIVLEPEQQAKLVDAGVTIVTPIDFS